MGVTSEWREVRFGAGHEEGSGKKRVMRWRLEVKGITVASPLHGEEGCVILVFVLCDFARMLGKMPAIPVRLSREVVR